MTLEQWINERSKLIKLKLRKTDNYYTIKDVSGKLQKIKQIPLRYLEQFLIKINAYDEYTMPVTSGINIDLIINDLKQGKDVFIYVPENRFNVLKIMMYNDDYEIKNNKKYNYDSKNYDVSDYENKG